MSPAKTWLLLLVVGAVCTIGSALFVSWLYRRDDSDDDLDDALVDQILAMPSEQASAVLRHPSWEDRCACRRYGTVNGSAHIHDEWGMHSPDRCQPDREML